jgi:hypothetical protein
VDLGKVLFRSDLPLKLLEHDLHQPFPESPGRKNISDLVHQRLSVRGIRADKWPRVLDNAAEVVKPDGALQLVEAEWVLSSYFDDQVQQKKPAKVQEWSLARPAWTFTSGDPPLPLDFEDMKVQTFNLGYGAASKRPENRIWTAELFSSKRTQSIQVRCLNPEGTLDGRLFWPSGSKSFLNHHNRDPSHLPSCRNESMKVEKNPRVLD